MKKVPREVFEKQVFVDLVFPFYIYSLFSCGTRKWQHRESAWPGLHIVRLNTYSFFYFLLFKPYVDLYGERNVDGSSLLLRRRRGREENRNERAKMKKKKEVVLRSGRRSEVGSARFWASFRRPLGMLWSSMNVEKGC